jgi:hypothetical protein
MTLNGVKERVRNLFGIPPSAAVIDEPQLIEQVSREQVICIIEAMSQQRRGVSAGQLLSAYRAGKLERPGEVADLLVYSDLLSPEDPIFGEPIQASRTESRDSSR